MKDKNLPQAPVGGLLLFQSDDGRARVECRFQSDTLWLSQATMTELYDKDVHTINEHLINILDEGGQDITEMLQWKVEPKDKGV